MAEESPTSVASVSVAAGINYFRGVVVVVVVVVVVT